MPARLLLIFTIIPLVELYLLIKIGSYLGALNTIFLLLATGFLGALLARWEGIKTFRQIAFQLSQGLVPGEEMVDGLLIFVAGVLLITPGVLTDVMGLFLLVPFTRTHFKRWLRKKFDRLIASGDIRLYFRGGS